MYQALQWLQNNNHLYKDVLVDYKCKSIETTKQPIPDVMLESGTTQHQKIVPSISKPNMLNDKKQDTSTNSQPVYTLPLPNNKPVDILGSSLETPIEELAFPWLFPYGVNGFTSQREKKITDLAYFQSRLMNYDTRFSADLPYLFFENSIYEARKLSSCISIALRMKTICSSDKQHKLQAKDLRGKINADIIEDSYVFMRNIRGTPAYWRNELLNLLAGIATLGPPTWFVTLSAADLQWQELFTLLSPKKHYSDLSSNEKWKLMRENTLLIAKHFNRRKQAFLKYILHGKSKPLGEITDYFLRIEFQLRGSPHIHMFLWVKGSPDLQTKKGCLLAPDFIDKYNNNT